MVKFKLIDIPETDKYYAGDNGNIYRLLTGRDNFTYEMKQLKNSTMRDRDNNKYVHVILFQGEQAREVMFPTAYLICGAYHGFYHIGYRVAFRDNDISNTKPDNLCWIFDRDYKSRERLIDKLLDVAYGKT